MEREMTRPPAAAKPCMRRHTINVCISLVYRQATVDMTNNINEMMRGGATAQLVAERADNHLPCGQPQHAECEGELYQRGGRVEIVDELGKCRQVEIGDKGTECRQHAHEE